MKILISLFLYLGYFYLIHILLFIVGGNVYDLMHAKQPSPKKRLPAYKPFVSVLIPAFNEQAVIERCLKSIAKTNYPKKSLEVIVISDASTDDTNKIVRKFIDKNKKIDVKLVARRTNRGKGYSLNYAIKSQAKGEIMVVYDADTVVSRNAIRKGVAYFRDENILGAASNVKILHGKSLLNLLQYYEYLIAYRSKKFYTVIGGEMIIGGVGSFYRMSAIKKYGSYDDTTITEDIGLGMKIRSKAGVAEKLVYASDSIVHTEGVPGFMQLLKQRYRWKVGMLQNLMLYSGKYAKNYKNQSKSLVFYRIPTAFLSELLLLLEPVLLTTVIMLSIVLATPSIFLAAYLTITAYSLYVLWFDEHTSLKEKVYYTFYSPAMYFLYFIMSFIQFASFIKCLMNIRLIVSSKNKMNSTWVSPTRVGGEAHATV